MCGIAGILDPGGPEPDSVRAMTAALIHRGPDDQGFHFEPGVGLGFRRLSIIDLEGGNQPIGNEDGSVQLVCNGEIYNYRELRKALGETGHAFASQSDVEVIVHLYEDIGLGLLDRLRGMFAFAIWDARQRRLVLARDHLGQKPLYWAQLGRRLYFASEIKAILAVTHQLRRLDPVALDEYLTLRVIGGDRSMFQGVRKLEAGHVLVVQEGQDAGSSHRYWDLLYEPKAQLSEEEALERLDAELRAAVQLHLESDVEVGAFLSGGVDSGLVAAMIHSFTGGGFKTFSVSTPYERFDEGPAARAVSDRYATEHHASSVSGDCVELLPAAVWHLDEPSDPLCVCMHYLAEVTRREVKVALGGDGGDELFGGYDRYYGAAYARYFAALPAAVRRGVVGRLLDLAPDEFWYKSLANQLRWLGEVAGVEKERRYARTLSYFYFTPQLRREIYTDSFLRSTRLFDAEASVAFWQQEENAKESLDQMLLADSMVRLPNHSVMILDRMTMAHGLEARSPFLDHRLAEFAATLPTRLKVRGRRRRYLEMKLAERYLPAEVLQRPKQGFSSALPYMMDREFGLLFQHYLPRSRLVEEGLLDAAAIRSMLDEHMARSMDHGNRLWLLLNAEIWHRVHLDQVAPEELRQEIRRVLSPDEVAVGPAVAAC